MEERGLDMEESPYYNKCALYVTMSMIHSDSIDTVRKYIGEGDVFGMVYDLAVDKLVDEDKRFNVRKYFGL